MDGHFFCSQSQAERQVVCDSVTEGERGHQVVVHTSRNSDDRSKTH